MIMTAEKLKAVQLLRRFTFEEWGGTETVVWNTAKELCGRGAENEILASSALSNIGGEVIDDVSIRRFGYFYPYFGMKDAAKSTLDKKGGDPFSPPLLRYLLSLQGLDIIHSHTMGRLANMARIAARRKNIPYVVSLHGGCFDVPKTEIDEMLKPLKGTFNYGRFFDIFLRTKKFMDQANGIVCVGHNEYLKACEKYRDKPVTYIPNGVSPEAFKVGDGERFRKKYGISETTQVTICVGRIDYQKNQTMLVELLARLKARGDDAHLVLVGPVTSATYHKQIESTIKDYSLEKSVTLIEGLKPTDKALFDAYTAGDIFILPSIHEPFGIVVLEAWAAGKVVIASRVGGLVKLIDDGETSLLFDTASLDDLLAKYDSVMGDPQYKNTLIANATKMVEKNYTWSVVVDRLVDFYGDVISNYQKKSANK